MTVPGPDVSARRCRRHEPRDDPRFLIHYTKLPAVRRRVRSAFHAGLLICIFSLRTAAGT